MVSTRSRCAGVEETRIFADFARYVYLASYYYHKNCSDAVLIFIISGTAIAAKMTNCSTIDAACAV